MCLGPADPHPRPGASDAAVERSLITVALAADDVRTARGDAANPNLRILRKARQRLLAVPSHNPTRAATVELYGVGRHVDRVRLLYEPLMERMLRQARASTWSPSAGVSLHEHRVRWMHGFTLSISARLDTAETHTTAADHHTGTDAHTRRHLADAERAETEKKRELPAVRPDIGGRRVRHVDSNRR